MDQPDGDISTGNLNMFRLTNGPSCWLEIRLFYVRISPCAIHTIPPHLTLRYLRREIGVSLEINGSRLPASETASITLRRDRVDKESSEVTYVSTDSVRVTGPIEIEVDEGDADLILCASLERMELENDFNLGWGMDCYTAIGSGGSASASGSSLSSSSSSSAFFQPKLGISSPSIEVYIAGCCSGVPVILTKTIQISPRRKPGRHATLDAIPEGEEIDKERRADLELLRHRKVQMAEAEVDDYHESDGKVGYGFYSEEMYPGEDGQLSWFNAGVRVGVGIGLGMCVGVGIGVGLLMRSYQATTRNFRRFF